MSSKRNDARAARKARKLQKKLLSARAHRDNELSNKALTKGLAPINREKLRSRSVISSFTIPTLAGRYYLDWKFQCIDCGSSQIWTGPQQKWWHEEIGGEIERIATRCRECRRKERLRREEARRIHLEGLLRKRAERSRPA